MKKNMKLMTSLGIIALAGSAVFAPAVAGAEDMTKITFCLDWTPNTNYTGLYAAQALGYFEEAGLEVEIVQPPEDGAVLMCASGQAQFAGTAQDSLAPALDSDTPLEVTTVAAILQHNTSGIITRAGEGMDTPKGMNDKTYSTWEAPVEMAMMENVVNADGGDFSTVKLIPNDITDEPAALAANQTDAIWVFYGWGGVNAEVEGVDCDFWFFSDQNEVFDYYTPTIIANNDFLEESPDVAKAFLAAMTKGYEYAIENPEDAADMLIEGDTTGSLRGSEELVYASQHWLNEQYIADASGWGVIDPERWDAFYSWLYENGLTTRDLTGIGYTNEYLPQAE